MGSDADVLVQPAHDARKYHIARTRKPRTSPSPDTVEAATGPQDRRADQLREWLLLLLRFAITHEAKDEAAAWAMADEIDALGLRWRPSAPNCFRRTSVEVCKAIAAPAGRERVTVLRKHLARIDDLRLQRAFEAAVELEQGSPRASSEITQRNLWTGLRR
jgi:hypothetical protein